MIGRMLYVETDPFHYAMYGPVKDPNGEVRIVAINNPAYYQQTFRCLDVRTSFPGRLRDDEDELRKVRDVFLAESRECPAASGKPTDSFIWSGTFFSDEARKYSAVRLNDNTVVYSSQYFPTGLARVIISDHIMIFIHYDDTITMKYEKCLCRDEKILINGIKKIDVDGKKISPFYPKEDKALKNHLKSHPIDETEFKLQQLFIKTLSEEKWSAGMKDYVSASVFNSFSGWGP